MMTDRFEGNFRQANNHLGDIRFNNSNNQYNNNNDDDEHNFSQQFYDNQLSNNVMQRRERFTTDEQQLEMIRRHQQRQSQSSHGSFQQQQQQQAYINSMTTSSLHNNDTEYDQNSNFFPDNQHSSHQGVHNSQSIHSIIQNNINHTRNSSRQGQMNANGNNSRLLESSSGYASGLQSHFNPRGFEEGFPNNYTTSHGGGGVGAFPVSGSNKGIMNSMMGLEDDDMMGMNFPHEIKFNGNSSTHRSNMFTSMNTSRHNNTGSTHAVSSHSCEILGTSHHQQQKHNQNEMWQQMGISNSNANDTTNAMNISNNSGRSFHSDVTGSFHKQKNSIHMRDLNDSANSFYYDMDNIQGSGTADLSHQQQQMFPKKINQVPITRSYSANVHGTGTSDPSHQQQQMFPKKIKQEPITRSFSTPVTVENSLLNQMMYNNRSGLNDQDFVSSPPTMKDIQRASSQHLIRDISLNSITNIQTQSVHEEENNAVQLTPQERVFAIFSNSKRSLPSDGLIEGSSKHMRPCHSVPGLRSIVSDRRLRASRTTCEPDTKLDANKAIEADSLLHNSCKLYPDTPSVVESALELDPDAICRPILIQCSTKDRSSIKKQGLVRIASNDSQNPLDRNSIKRQGIVRITSNDSQNHIPDRSSIKREAMVRIKSNDSQKTYDTVSTTNSNGNVDDDDDDLKMKPSNIGIPAISPMVGLIREWFSYPINIALRCGTVLEVVDILAKAGPDVLLLPDGLNKSNSLDLALHRGYEDGIVQLLLSVNREAAKSVDRDANTPLHTAVKVGTTSKNVFAMIYKAYPDAVRSRNFHGSTPLDLAIRSPSCPEEIVDYLQNLSSSLEESHNIADVDELDAFEC